MRRCIALLTDISQGKLRRAEQLTDADWAAITTAAAVVAERRLWIDDTSLPTLTHVRSESVAQKVTSGLGLVLVDYCQLVQGDGANRYEQLRDVAYGFKALAKDLQVPVILLAQLNRGVESREDKRPHLSDLRDSGAIEEAADIVGLLYSRAYYDKDFGMPYVLECAIEKNRNGERGQCLWQFEGAFSRITALNSGAAAQYRHLCTKQHQRAGNDL
jgi:replicative DNA helicase